MNAERAIFELLRAFCVWALLIAIAAYLWTHYTTPCSARGGVTAVTMPPQFFVCVVPLR